MKTPASDRLFDITFAPLDWFLDETRIPKILRVLLIIPFALIVLPWIVFWTAIIIIVNMCVLIK